MDSKNMIIAVLSVTAVVLLCTLVLLHSDLTSRDASLAWADTMDRGGDYILATGSLMDGGSTSASGTSDPLYALDASNDKLNVYQYDLKQQRLVLYDSLDLRTYFVSP